jgi:hypothetical protein
MAKYIIKFSETIQRGELAMGGVQKLAKELADMETFAVNILLLPGGVASGRGGAVTSEEAISLPSPHHLPLRGLLLGGGEGLWYDGSLLYLHEYELLPLQSG